jgi:phosphopentomutase
MTERGLSTLSIGKIWDLFAERGISEHIKTANNSEGIAATIDAIASDASAKLIFTNLVDFDQLWGHRNDPHSFARALEEFDARLGQIVDAMKHDDMLIVTADHGCDPTLTYSTDHTREYVPLLVYGMSLRSGGDLGTRSTFADVASTISDLFKLNHSFPGTSFAHEIGAK